MLVSRAFSHAKIDIFDRKLIHKIIRKLNFSDTILKYSIIRLI